MLNNNDDEDYVKLTDGFILFSIESNFDQLVLKNLR